MLQNRWGPACALVDELPTNRRRPQSLLWGTYRPNLYFGMRPRLPASLLTGLMWFGAHDFQSYHKTRHACDQADGLVYNFKEHDGRTSAVQVIKDGLNNVEIKISLLKVPADKQGMPLPLLA